MCLHPPERPVSSQSLGLIGLDRFVLTHHPTPTAQRYEIRAVTADGGEGPVLAAGQQQRHPVGDKVTFFADDTHRHPVFSFRHRPQAGASSAYDVLDAGGRPIGQLRREVGPAAGASTWHVEADGVRARAEQRVAGLLSRLRAGARVASLDVVDAQGRAVMCSERQRGTDRCVVTVLDARLDARVAAALVVALDALR